MSLIWINWIEFVFYRLCMSNIPFLLSSSFHHSLFYHWVARIPCKHLRMEYGMQFYFHLWKIGFVFLCNWKLPIYFEFLSDVRYCSFVCVSEHKLIIANLNCELKLRTSVPKGQLGLVSNPLLKSFISTIYNASSPAVGRFSPVHSIHIPPSTTRVLKSQHEWFVKSMPGITIRVAEIINKRVDTEDLCGRV